MKATNFREEEIFDEEDDEYSDESESSGDHDDDGEVEPPTQAAFNALLKRWLHAENQSHLAGLVVMWEIQTSALPVILAASEAFQTARDLELVNITNEMRTWLTPNDPTGEYGKYWEEVDTELRQYQETREDCTNTRIEQYKVAERIRNQSATPPETIPAYVEARALYKRAEKEKAANDALIDDFIAQAAFRQTMPQPTSTGGTSGATGGGTTLSSTPPAGTPPTTAGTPPIRGGTPPPVAAHSGLIHDTLFAQMKVESGYAIIREYPELVYPSRHPKAAILERTTIQALRVGMPVPVLQFSGTPAFANLIPPQGYYVVISEHVDGSIRMALGYETPGANLPQVLVFEKQATPFTLLALSDTAIRGGMVHSFILDNLRKLHSPLTAPDTPISDRLHDPTAGGTGYHTNGGQAVKATKAFAPLRRALHNDSGKFQILTQHMSEMKLTDPALAVNIRNMSCAPALHGIIALQADNIPHLLGFNYCVELDFSGKDNKLDAINLYAFATELTKFECLNDIRKAIETMKRTYMLVMMEDSRNGYPHWGRIFNKLLDQLQEIDPCLSIEDLDITYTAWKFNTLIAAWAALYKGGLHATKTQEEFTKINEDMLQFNPADWISQGNLMCKTKIPPQKVPPKKQPEDRSVKRRQDQATPPTTDGGKRKRQRNKTTKQPPTNAQKTIPAPAQPQAQQQAPTNPPDICVRNLFHNADAALFPGSCKPGCKRNHNPRLRNGKLTAADKAGVKASLDAMTGKFAELALQELDRLF